jgi:biotin synthase
VTAPPPEIGRYRALQLARYLITTGRTTVDAMRFDDGRLAAIDVSPDVAARALATGIPFRTSGCPDCNRPLYNERPGGPMYNYAAPLSDVERAAARRELAAYLSLPNVDGE